MKSVSDKNLILAIELKEEGIEKDTLEIIDKYYNKANIFITSFLYNALSNVRKFDNNIKIGWLIEDDINHQISVFNKKVPKFCCRFLGGLFRNRQVKKHYHSHKFSHSQNMKC